jgi:hypothetical protein
LGRVRLLTGTMFLVLAAGVVPVEFQGGPIGLFQASAQNIGQRVVQGKVVDADSAAIAGATVFLKNLKTKSIRSFTTETDGRFRFTQVNMAEDYDLWAEKGDRKSPTKSVSSWDSRKDFEAELKMK